MSPYCTYRNSTCRLGDIRASGVLVLDCGEVDVDLLDVEAAIRARRSTRRATGERLAALDATAPFKAGRARDRVRPRDRPRARRRSRDTRLRRDRTRPRNRARRATRASGRAGFPVTESTAKSIASANGSTRSSAKPASVAAGSHEIGPPDAMEWTYPGYAKLRIAGATPESHSKGHGLERGGERRHEIARETEHDQAAEPPRGFRASL